MRNKRQRNNKKEENKIKQIKKLNHSNDTNMNNTNNDNNHNNDNSILSTKHEDGYKKWTYENKDFEKYYKNQNIIPDNEWEIFMKYLAIPLPASFRINKNCIFTEQIRTKIKEFSDLNIEIDGEIQTQLIKEMAWYPDRRGFQIQMDRRSIRKNEKLIEFKTWLGNLTECGITTRQEEVSMIPPLVLKVENHHKLLDMCAAPGSKSSQLLEMLHSDSSNNICELPQGFLIANELNFKRAGMLVKQSKRMNSAALMVTCHDAQNFPSMKDFVESNENDKCNDDEYFDRILCDVPCSGDGTLRKNPTIWRKWTLRDGLSLHSIQLRIAKRAASLLKTGGFMCYSTCSFNPIENEAVVNALVQWSNGALEIVNINNNNDIKLNILPELKARKGLNQWKVFNSKYEIIEKNNFQKNNDNVKMSMFPPSEDDLKIINLEHCIRLVPHDSNTGGFFVCLLKKKFPIPVTAKDDTNKVIIPNDPLKTDDLINEKCKIDTVIENPESEKITISNKKNINNDKITSHSRGVKNMIQYRPLEEFSCKNIIQSYHLSNVITSNLFYTRSDQSKIVTVVNPSLANHIVMKNLTLKKLHVIHIGNKAFERYDPNKLKNTSSSCTYRFAQTGTSLLAPFVELNNTNTNRFISIQCKDFQYLLENYGTFINFDFSDDLELNDLLRNIEIGSIIFVLKSIHFKNSLYLSVWRGKSTLNVMASKVDIQELLLTIKSFGLYTNPTLTNNTNQALELNRNKSTRNRNR